MNWLSLRNNRLNFRKITDHFRGLYRVKPNVIEKNRMAPTCNRLDLETLGNLPIILPKNLPERWYQYGTLCCGLDVNKLWGCNFLSLIVPSIALKMMSTISLPWIPRWVRDFWIVMLWLEWVDRLNWWTYSEVNLKFLVVVLRWVMAHWGLLLRPPLMIMKISWHCVFFWANSSRKMA